LYFFGFGRDRGSAGGLEFGEGLYRAEVAAVKAGLVAGEEAEGVGGVGKRFPGVGGASGFVDADVFLFELGLEAGHFVVEEGGFKGPGAVLTPFAGDDLFDEVRFGRAYGLVLVEVGGTKGLEFDLTFVVEDDGFGEHAVSGGVLGSALFTLGGFGTFGFGAVLAGGLDLLFGGHE